MLLELLGTALLAITQVFDWISEGSRNYAAFCWDRELMFTVITRSILSQTRHLLECTSGKLEHQARTPFCLFTVFYDLLTSTGLLYKIYLLTYLLNHGLMAVYF